MMPFQLSDEAAKKTENIIEDARRQTIVRKTLVIVLQVTLPIWAAVGALIRYVGLVFFSMIRPRQTYKGLYHYIWERPKLNKAAKILSDDFIKSIQKGATDSSSSESHSSYYGDQSPPDKLLN